MRILVLPLALLAIGTWPALAQDTTETQPAETTEDAAATDQGAGDQSADTEAAETEAAAVAPPAFNGSASGDVMGSALNTQVVCNIAGDSWTVQSDPGDAPGEDTNGDGNLVDISANAATGDIFLNVLAGGMYVTFQDSGAEFEGNTMRYSVIVSMAGSPDEQIDIQITCS